MMVDAAAAAAAEGFVVDGKLLAASDKEVRKRAVAELEEWVGSGASGLEEEAMMRLWKGLYYCMWMCDKSAPQQELALTFAGLIPKFKSSPRTRLYFHCFFRTMEREWFGLDRLRLDKFYMLIRKMIQGYIAWIGHDMKFDSEELDYFCEMLRDTILMPKKSNSEGLKSHVAFVFVDEIHRSFEQELAIDHLQELLAPFYCVLANPPSHQFFMHTHNFVFRKLLEFHGPSQHKTDSKQRVFDHLDLEVIAQSLFNIAADSKTVNSKQRSELYGLCQTLRRHNKAIPSSKPNLEKAKIFSPTKAPSEAMELDADKSNDLKFNGSVDVVAAKQKPKPTEQKSKSLDQGRKSVEVKAKPANKKAEAVEKKQKEKPVNVVEPKLKAPDFSTQEDPNDEMPKKHQLDDKTLDGKEKKKQRIALEVTKPQEEKVQTPKKDTPNSEISKKILGQSKIAKYLQHRALNSQMPKSVSANNEIDDSDDEMEVEQHNKAKEDGKAKATTKSVHFALEANRAFAINKITAHMKKNPIPPSKSLASPTVGVLKKSKSRSAVP